MEAAKSAFTQQMNSSGANSELAGSFIDSVGALGAALSSNTSVNEGILGLLEKGIAFILSQESLQNLTTDPDIINDSNFKPFVDSFNELKSQIEEFLKNPENAMEYFSGITDEWGEFFAAMVTVSKQVTEKKLKSL